MKIGLVVEKFDPLRGGLEQWSYQFTSRLLEQGHEVHVVAGQFGDQVHAMPIVAHRIGRTRSRVGFAEAAEHKLRALDLDVIHDTGAGWYCDIFQPHGGSRQVALEHNLLRLPGWMRPLKRHASRWLPRYRQFRKLMDRQYVDDGRLFLALSRETASAFERLHGMSADRIRVVYNGVDTERFSPKHSRRYRPEVRRRLGLDDRTLLLLTVAHNFRLKGVPTLIQAVGRLAERQIPIHLTVVGGKQPERWNRYAHRAGVGASVTFTGSVRDTVPFYAAADVYVHPTFHDSCSLVVLEALAGGLPVVTSRLNGASELMTDGREGFILPDPADVGGLVRRLESMFDASLRARMGRDARRLAEAHTLQRNVDEVLEVYDEVLASKNRRSKRDRPVRRPFVVQPGVTGIPPGATRTVLSINSAYRYPRPCQ